MRISDWSSDVCSSDLIEARRIFGGPPVAHRATGVDLAALIVETMGDFMPDHRSDRAIIDRIVDALAEIGPLQDAGRKHDLVLQPAIIGVHRLRDRKSTRLNSST